MSKSFLRAIIIHALPTEILPNTEETPLQTAVVDIFADQLAPMCVYEAGRSITAVLLGIPCRDVVFSCPGAGAGYEDHCSEIANAALRFGAPMEQYSGLLNCMLIGHAGASAERLIHEMPSISTSADIELRLRISLILYPSNAQYLSTHDDNRPKRQRLEVATGRLCTALLEEHVYELRSLSIFFSECVIAGQDSVTITAEEILAKIGHLAGKYSISADYRLECNHTVPWIHGIDRKVLFCDICHTNHPIVHVFLSAPLNKVNVHSPGRFRSQDWQNPG